MCDNRDPKVVADHILRISSERGHSHLVAGVVNKLAYLCHGYMLAQYDEPFLDDTFQVFPTGPMSPAIYQAYDKYGLGKIEDIPPVINEDLSARQREVVDQVLNKYGELNFVDLSEETHHKDSPWDVVHRQDGLWAEISNETIALHFKTLLRSRSLN